MRYKRQHAKEWNNNEKKKSQLYYLNMSRPRLLFVSFHFWLCCPHCIDFFAPEYEVPALALASATGKEGARRNCRSLSFLLIYALLPSSFHCVISSSSSSSSSSSYVCGQRFSFIFTDWSVLFFFSLFSIAGTIGYNVDRGESERFFLLLLLLFPLQVFCEQQHQHRTVDGAKESSWHLICKQEKGEKSSLFFSMFFSLFLKKTCAIAWGIEKRRGFSASARVLIIQRLKMSLLLLPAGTRWRGERRGDEENNFLPYRKPPF